MASRSIESIRKATVSVCSESGAHIGQGLLLGDGAGGAVVLTCHHVATAVPGHKLHVAVPDSTGRLSPPVRATYDHPRSRSTLDLALLRIGGTEPDRPLLHALDPERYDGGLPQRVTGFTYLSPWTFDAHLGTATPLRCAVPEHGRTDVPEGDYEIDRAFRLVDPTDTREGISGAPVVCDGGVLGLAHFARDGGDQGRPEAYMVPLLEWARAWPELESWIEPFVDQSLRNAARVKRAGDLDIGIAAAPHNDPDLTVAGYQAGVYVPHPVADRAAESLQRFDEVLIIGRPMSGKTRLARELLRDKPEVVVVIPEADVPFGRFELAGLSAAEIVLLCDDIHLTTGRINVLQWRRRLAQSGARVRVILTCRDGDDWRRVRQADSALADRFRESAVLLSADGARGTDFPAKGSQALAGLLGLSEERLSERFDGTPGSLTLDLTAMQDRYDSLREEQVHGVPLSRLLDSIKLLHHCGQSPVRETRVRQVAETVRGDGKLPEDAWEALRRRTAAAGFGAFVDGSFRGYLPLIEQCVEYEPTADACEALSELLGDDEAWSELQAFAGAQPVPERIRENTLEWVIGKADGDPALAAHLELALLHAGQDRTEEAIDGLRRVIDSGDADRGPEAAVLLGALFERWGRSEDAVVSWQQVIDSSDARFAPQAAARLGLLRAEEGETDDAASAYRIAVESGRPEVAGVAAYNLAHLQEDLDPEEQLRLLRVAVDSGDERAAPAAAIRLAIRTLDAEDAGEVTLLLRVAAGSQDPDVAAMAAVHLGMADVEEGDIEGAKRSLYPVAESGKKYLAPVAALLLALVLGRNGEIGEAVRILQIARSSEDEDLALQAAARIGELLAGGEDFEGAAEAFQEARSAPGEIGELATVNLGVVEWHRGHRREALRLLQMGREADDENVRRQASSTEALMRAWEDGRNEDAIAELSALIESADEEIAADSSYSLGQLYRRSGDLDAAAKALRQACATEGEWEPRARIELGSVELARGNIELAIDLLQEVVAAFGGDPPFGEGYSAALRLGALRMKQEEMQAAIEPLRIAIRADEGDVRDEARLRLGMVLCDSGAMREGLGLLQDVVDAGAAGFAPVAAHYIGLKLAEDDDWLGAAEAWRRMLEFEDSELRPRAWRLLGTAYLHIGQTDAAIEALEQAARSGSAGIAPDAAQRLSNLLVDQGDFDRAAELLHTAIGDTETAAARHAIVALGAVEEMRGETDEAVRLWGSMLRDPLDEPAAFAAGNLALARSRADDEEGVGEMLTLLSESGRDDVHVEVMTVLSDSYFEQGEHERGRLMLRRIVDSGHPKYAPRTAWRLGLLLLDEKELAEAGEILRVAVDSHQQDISEAAALLLGALNRQRGQLDAACRLLEIAARSSNPAIGGPAALELGEVLMEQGAGARAQAAFRLAIDCGDGRFRAAAICELASLLEDDGAAEDALELWTEAMASGQPEHVARAALAIGTTRLEQEDLDGAEEALKTAISSGSDVVAGIASINLVALKDRQGKSDEAKDLASKLVGELDGPLAARASITLAELCLGEEDFDGATRALAAVIEADDPLYAPEAAIRLAAVCSHAGKPDEAVEAFLEQAANHDEFVASGVQLALALVKEGAVADAAQILERVMDAADGEVLPFVALTQGHVLANLERNEEAERAFEIVLRSEHDHFAPSAALALGKLLQLDSRLADAKHLFEVAIASERTDCAPEAAFYLGLAYYDAGEIEKAARQWELAVGSEHPGAAPVAALNLGVLHHSEGRLEQAVDAWQVAIDSGHEIYSPEAAKMLQLVTQTGS